jgi:DNA adenine methylase
MEARLPYACYLMVGPLAYIGGKNRLAKQIIALFPKHKTYVEAFAGGAQVFFHKDPSKVEVLNDLDGEVVNFFRVCQWHHEELLRSLRFTLVSREWFDSFKATNPIAFTDVQRAVRFFYLQKNCFAGLVRNPTYHYHVTKQPGFNLERLPEVIEKTHKRLQKVQVEHLPYEEILKRYDRPSTLFYLDPPYWDRKLYRFNFTESDFVELEMRLRKVRGKFILSLNDAPEVRKLFGRFRFHEIDLHYTAQKEAGKRYRELLITNFSHS